MQSPEQRMTVYLWKACTYSIVIPDTYNELRVLRIGRSIKDKPRPFKIVFQNESVEHQFCDSFSCDLVADADVAWKDISISRDRTPKERQYLNDLRAELKKPSKGGEEISPLSIVSASLPSRVWIQKTCKRQYTD